MFSTGTSYTIIKIGSLKLSHAGGIIRGRFVFTLLLFWLFLRIQAQRQETSSIESCLAPFYHGVASGDPMSDRVIIWTRVTPDTVSSDPILVSWQMAKDTGMAHVVQSGSVITDHSKDYTIKIDVTGLKPNMWYYYEFTCNGKTSPRGRTRTAPLHQADSLRFAIVSCANLEAGFFNAYKVLLNRADFDAVICLGDYIYEYETGGYSFNRSANRRWLPSHEIVSLNDYRQRYSSYHLDEDLRKLHQQFPFITIWDDHETANDAWMNGAKNHASAAEGPFSVRKASAKQAYFEWLPIRQQVGAADPYQLFRKLSYGNLADFIMLDTRLHGRDEHHGTRGAIVKAKTRQLLGTDQYTWLGDRLDSSLAQWKIITQQVIIAPVKVFGVALNDDQWDGYPAERDRVLNHILNHQIKDAVFITGDMHSSWANDLPTSTNYRSSTGEGSAGVEFVTPSVTSPSDGNFIGGVALKAINPHIKYINYTKHGFMILDINKTRIQNDWYYVNTINSSSDQYEHGKSMYVKHQERFLRHTDSVSVARPSIYGIMAPLCPRFVGSSTNFPNQGNQIKLSNVMVNAEKMELLVTFMGQPVGKGKMTLYNDMGKVVHEFSFHENNIYDNQLQFDIKQLAKGAYRGIIEIEHQSLAFKFVKQTD